MIIVYPSAPGFNSFIYLFGLLIGFYLIILKVPSFPDDVAMALIDEELGRPWNETYSELTSSPIAAGILMSCVLLCQVTFSTCFGPFLCLYDV